MQPACLPTQRKARCAGTRRFLIEHFDIGEKNRGTSRLSPCFGRDGRQVEPHIRRLRRADHAQRYLGPVIDGGFGGVNVESSLGVSWARTGAAHRTSRQTARNVNRVDRERSGSLVIWNPPGTNLWSCRVPVLNRHAQNAEELAHKKLTKAMPALQTKTTLPCPNWPMETRATANRLAKGKLFIFLSQFPHVSHMCK